MKAYMINSEFKSREWRNHNSNKKWENDKNTNNPT